MAAPKLSSQDTLSDLFSIHEKFSKVLLDAYVLIDPNGLVVKSNQLFSQLVGTSTKQLQGKALLGEHIEFYLSEKKLGIEEFNGLVQTTRIDEVEGRTKLSNNLNLILGAYPICSESKDRLGTFLLIRDVTAETNLQNRYKDAANKSITDPLTSLFTRGYFEDYLRLQLSLAKNQRKSSEQESPISIVMVDIDHFKKVNDVYGHQAGDHILKVVAHTMKGVFRKSDVCCRYGGEEFLVILPETTLEGAANAAEKMRKTVESLSIDFEGKKIPVTMSSGVAQIDIQTEEGKDTIARADAALYKAKEAGRNKVMIADPVKQ